MSQDQGGKQGRRLLVFVRHPEPGSVKTRLAKTRGEAFAAELYGCFVDDLLAALAGGHYRLEIHFAPADREAELRRRFGGRFACLPQEGEGLGERMENAFRSAFARGAATAVLIGSDIPDLTSAVAEEAFAALENGHDAVLGPALDGGYYLIGFRAGAFATEVFRGMAWGEGTVGGETLRRLRGKGMRLHLAPLWRDIDTEEDLAVLASRHTGTPFDHSRTMALLRRRGSGSSPEGPAGSTSGKSDRQTPAAEPQGKERPD